jgi:regulatory protein
MSTAADWPAPQAGEPANPVSGSDAHAPATSSGVNDQEVRLNRAKNLLRAIADGQVTPESPLLAPDVDSTAKATHAGRGSHEAAAEGANDLSTSADGADDEADNPHEDPYEKARVICLNQLNHSARTRSHLEGVLAKRGIEPEVAESVLDRLEQVGLIDDSEFAHAWVRSRQRSKGLSRRRLASELQRAGVAKDLIEEALLIVADEDEIAAARTLAQKKAKTLAGLEPDASMRRIAGLLARKGYSPNTCFEVAREAVRDAAQSS